MRRVIITTAALLLLSINGRNGIETEGAICPWPGAIPEARLLAIERENGCLDDAMLQETQPWPPGWKTAAMAGGDIQPARVVSDPYPTLHSVVVDAERNKVFVSDPNRHALWSYDRLAPSKGKEMIEPLTGIRGPATGMMFIAAVTIDREAQEIYTVDNDIGDRMMVFPYDAAGNVKPKRVLDVPHQAWGLSISQERNELAVTVESSRQIVIYRKQAEGREPPLRVIRGPQTGLGDPHGVFLDGKNHEIVVANHGNQGGREAPPGDAPPRQRGGPRPEPPPLTGGHFDEPSIATYNADAKGDVAPI